MEKKAPKKKTKKRKKQKFKIILAIVLVFVCVLLVFVSFVMSKYNKLDRIDIKREDIKINELSKETQEVLEEYTTIALFGLDNRSNGNFESGNSDTIIVASINNKTGEIKMVSVYRDTYMDIGDNTFRKANAAYNNGGPKQAINMLNTSLDLNITDYVSVDFNALVTVIDLLEGIELEINEVEAENMIGFIDEVSEMTGISSSYVSAGTQTVDGVQATAYSRIRQTTGWDYKRTERQRTVIAKIFEKAKSADILKLNSILDTVLPDISTSLSVTELLSLAKDAGKYSMGESSGFPYEKESGDVGKLGSTVIAVDFEANVREMHAFLFTNESYEPSARVKELSETIHANTGY